ncbi:hypothetical protein FRC17_009856, partial [Serendipita sp. 399]
MHDYCCRSGSHLAQVLELVGDAYFELFLYTPIVPSTDEVWNSVPWQKLQTQCVKIIARSTSYDSPDDPDLTAVPMAHRLPPLHKLQYLSLHEDKLTSSILHKTDQNTHNLRGMDVSYIQPSGSPFDPRRVKDVLANLQSFSSSRSHAGSFSTDFSITLLSSFRNLKDLTWNGPAYNPGNVQALRESVNWGFKLDKLETYYTLLSGFPADPILNHLKELVISTSWEDEAIERVFELPSLTDLTLVGLWIGLFQINAPNLVRLALHGTWGFPSQGEIADLDLSEINLCPRILDIHDDGLGVVVGCFLRGPFTELEELTIHVRAEWVEAGHLKQLLSEFVTERVESCRNLRHLKVFVDPKAVSCG